MEDRGGEFEGLRKNVWCLNTLEVKNTHQSLGGPQKEDYHPTAKMDSRFEATGFRKEMMYRCSVSDMLVPKGFSGGLVTGSEATLNMVAGHVRMFPTMAARY